MISRNTFNGAFPVKRLGDVVEFLDSQRRPVTQSERRTGPYPYYGANGPQGTIDDFIFDEPLLLLAEDGGHFDEPERGIAYRISGKTWVNNHAHVLKPRPIVDLAYLFRVLENYNVKPFVTGTTRGKLTKTGASEIPIPIPPLTEQRRIAEILDQAELLRTKRRAAFAQLDTLTTSIFLYLFGDPATNHKGWPMFKLVQVSDKITDGEHQTPQRTAHGIKLLSARNIRNGFIDVTDVDFISPEEHERIKRRCNPELGDVLISCSGTIGRVATVPTAEPFSLVRSVALIKPNREIVDSVFLENYLRTPALHARMQTSANASSQANLFQGQIRELPVMLAPLSLQHEFSHRVAVIEKIRVTHRKSLAELDALFASLQHRAFRGEL